MALVAVAALWMAWIWLQRRSSPSRQSRSRNTGFGELPVNRRLELGQSRRSTAARLGRAVEVDITDPTRPEAVRMAVSRGMAELAKRSVLRARRQPSSMVLLLSPTTAALLGGHGALLMAPRLVQIDIPDDVAIRARESGGRPLVRVLSAGNAVSDSQLWLIEAENSWSFDDPGPQIPDVRLDKAPEPGSSSRDALYPDRRDGEWLTPAPTAAHTDSSPWGPLAGRTLGGDFDDVTAVEQDASIREERARQQALRTLQAFEARLTVQPVARTEREERDSDDARSRAADESDSTNQRSGRLDAPRRASAYKPELPVGEELSFIEDHDDPAVRHADLLPADRSRRRRSRPVVPAVWLYDLNAPLAIDKVLAAVGSLPAAGGVVGRSEHADVTISSPGVSAAHFRIEPRPQGWMIHDLGSSNGTFVNGRRLDTDTAYPLRSYDKIKLGKTIRLLFVVGSDGPEAMQTQWASDA